MNRLLVKVLVFLTIPFLLSCGEGEVGPSKDVTVAIGAGIIVTSPVFDIDPATGAYKKFEPNNFRIGFSVTNTNTQYDLYISEIVVNYTYIKKLGGLGTGTVSYEFNGAVDKYIMEVGRAASATVATTVPKSGLLFYGLDVESEGPSYDLEFQLKGFFSSQGIDANGYAYPEQRFEKIVSATVD